MQGQDYGKVLKNKWMEYWPFLVQMFWGEGSKSLSTSCHHVNRYSPLGTVAQVMPCTTSASHVVLMTFRVRVGPMGLPWRTRGCCRRWPSPGTPGGLSVGLGAVEIRAKLPAELAPAGGPW